MNKDSETISINQDDIIEKINKLSEKYTFTRSKPYGQKTDDFFPQPNKRFSIKQPVATDQQNLFYGFKRLNKGKLNGCVLEKVTYKNQLLDDNTILLLQEGLDGYKHLTVLKFEFCGITGNQILMIHNLIQALQLIEEVSLNGNPVKEQNYAVLLRHNLKTLSLKYCGINEEGAKQLAEELSTPYDNPLLHLNLACNALFDEGVKYIAKILRLNRTIISLNLADNKIRDEGLLQLLEPLQKFKLDHDEIILRRQFKFDYQRKLLNSVTIRFSLQGDKGVQLSTSQRNFGKRLQSFVPSNIQKKKGKSPPVINKVKQITLAQPPPAELPKHPLLQNSIEEEESIYCTGNNVLINLNLAYNRITDAVVKDIVNMLEYQNVEIEAFHEDDKKGLNRLTITGNELTENALLDIKFNVRDDFTLVT